MGLVRIGKVVRAVGLKGHLGVTGWDESLSTVSQLTLERAGEGGLRKILEARPQGGIWAILLDGVEDRTGAERLVGSEVLVQREELGEAGEGRLWRADLEGLPVVTLDGRPVGTVTGFYGTGGVDVLVVGREGGEVLIPLAPYVMVDLKAGRITVDPPEGLFDLSKE